MTEAPTCLKVPPKTARLVKFIQASEVVAGGEKRTMAAIVHDALLRLKGGEDV